MSRRRGIDGGTVMYIESKSCVSELCVITSASDGSEIYEYTRLSKSWARAYLCANL